MSADIIGLDGSKIGAETSDNPELTNITPPTNGVWEQAVILARKQKASWGAVIFADDEGEVRAVWVNADRPSLRGLIEEIRDKLREQIKESYE